MEGKTYLDRITLVSGGQTGVDRAVLDFCLEHGRQCGGWCPEGRRAEDGTIDQKYPLTELPGGNYPERTAANVAESDATVVLYHREIEGGTLLSLHLARDAGRPFLLLDMSTMGEDEAAALLLEFIRVHEPMVLNFSGPRKSEWPEGYSRCYTLLQQAFGSPHLFDSGSY